MNPANCPSLQKSLAWCEGAPSHPGIRRRIYFCNKNLIVAYPTLARDSLGRPVSAVLQGEFELKADAYWQFLDINIDKSTVKSDPQGERPSQTQLNKGTFLHNGVGPEATAAAAWLNNSDNVYVYEDMLGRFRVLGNNKWATTSKVTQDQGQGTNPASTLIEVEVTDEVAAPFYNGPLETEEGTITPETEAEDENEGNDIGATVTTRSLELGYGQTGQIEVSPEDTNWSFESSNSNIASVNGNGLVTAGRTTGTARISCMYKGIEIKRITVTVGIMQGEDPDPNDPETPADPNEPTVGGYNYTKVQVTLTTLGNYIISEISGFDLDRCLVENASVAQLVRVKESPSDEISVIAIGVGQTIIHCFGDGELVDIEVKVLNEEINMIPESTQELALIPCQGWTATSSDDGIATVEEFVEEGNFVITSITEGQTAITFANDNGQQLVFIVHVDGQAVG